MATATSNGHASNVRRHGLRAPEGGLRIGGKYYRSGQLMPAKYRRMVEDTPHDPASGVPLSSPNFGRTVLPHAITFIGKQSTVAHVYRNPDEAVLRSGGQAWKMRRDPTIMECLESRQRGTALFNWHLEVEDERDPEQKQLKEELTKIVKRTYQFTEYRRCLLEALWYGRYAVQHQFGHEMIGGKRRTIIKGWRPVNGDKLIFRFDDGSGRYRDDEVGIRVTPIYGQKDVIAGGRRLEVTDVGMCYFLEPWERSLLAIHRHIIEDGDYEDPVSAGRIHGVGVRDRIYWCWYQKQETMAQLMEVIDRTGSGITIYWYPAGNPQAEAETIDLAEKQKHENVLVMPRMSGDPAQDAYGIERIEPTSAGIDAMSKIVDEFFGDQIMRYICGGTLFSKSKSLGIGGGGADIQEQSFYTIIQYDSVKLEETISTEMVLPLKGFNFPWARDIPVFFRIDTDSPDSQEKLQAAKTAWDMGAKILTKDLMSKVGMSIPKEGDDYLQNPQFAQQGIPGQPGGAQPGQPGDLQDMFGPLAAELGGGAQPGGGEPGQPPPGGPEGGQPAPNPPEGGGPVQYAKLADDFKSQLKRAISETDRHPSDEQKAAGNYSKGKVNWHGLTITLENPAGTKRRPEWKPLAHHYGYINRTEGKDGDHVDCFIGPNPESGVVYVVDQKNKAGGFDEHKCMLGFENEHRARAGYLANYQDGWQCGPITGLTIPQFKSWLEDGDTSKPVEQQVSRYAKRQIRSSPGQQPLAGLVDPNTRAHYLWKETLHPRAPEGSASGGQFVSKAGSHATSSGHAQGATVKNPLSAQHGQGMLFSELAAKLHETEHYPDSKTAKAQQADLFKTLAQSDVHPEQLHALLSGDEERMRGVQEHALATGQHEPPTDLSEEEQALAETYKGLTSGQVRSEVARRKHQSKITAATAEPGGEGYIPADSSQQDWNAAAIPPKEAEQIVSRVCSGRPESKNKGEHVHLYGKR